jgi:hypothetical protein
LKNARKCPCSYETWENWPSAKKKRSYDVSNQLEGLRRRVGRVKRGSGRTGAAGVDTALGVFGAVAGGAALINACNSGNCDTEIDKLIAASKALENSETNGDPQAYFKCTDYFSAWGDTLGCLGGDSTQANVLGEYTCGILYAGGVLSV